MFLKVTGTATTHSSGDKRVYRLVTLQEQLAQPGCFRPGRDSEIPFSPRLVGTVAKGKEESYLAESYKGLHVNVEYKVIQKRGRDARSREKNKE